MSILAELLTMHFSRQISADGVRIIFRFLAIIVALHAAASYAQTWNPKGYLIESWDTQKGLPQNTVTGMAQTPDGFLWISTLDGLARFDGVRFKVFRAGNTPALGSGRIRFLFPGGPGEFWLATQEGGLIQYAGSVFLPVALPEFSSAKPAVIQLARDEAGALWLSMENGSVVRSEKNGFAYVSTNWSSSGKTAFQVRADAQGQLLAISDTGFCSILDRQVYPVQRGKRGEYQVLCARRAGGWWVSTNGHPCVWGDGKWELTLPALEPGGAEIRSALEDRSGNLWIGTWGNGLFRCSTNGPALRVTKKDGLCGDFVRTLCEDSEGSLWVGAEGSGLSRLRLPLFTVYGLEPGLSWDWVTTVSEAPDGNLWVGTDGYGLNLLRDDMIVPAADAATISPRHVISAMAARNGKLWVGTRQGGLFTWEQSLATRVSGLPTVTSMVRSLYEDHQGVVWVGRRETDVLIKVANGTVAEVKLPEAAGRVDIRVMKDDNAGGLWIGTDGGGLFHLNNEGRFARYTRENGLGSDLVWALHPEEDGSLWVGTYGSGLTRLKNGRMATCTTRNGLVDDVICYIADDGQGRYWISSHQGVFSVSKKDLTQFANGNINQVRCMAYGKSDGLPTLECRGGFQPVGWQGRNGRIWLSTVGGVVTVDPATANRKSPPPPVYLEEIFVDGRLITPDEWRRTQDGLPKPRADVFKDRKETALALPAGSRRFEFHYTGVSLNTPERLRFRHRLDGVDADWVETGERREASYHRLPYGTYVFRVQTCNREGVWNTPGDMVSFRVLPFFYQTWWFIAFFLLTFGGGVGWAVGISLKRRHQRHLALMEQLHAAEQERARIARDIHDDLGSSLTEIGLLGALALRDSTPPAEARDQVARMMSKTEHLTRKLDETVWAVKPENDTLRHLASYLCNFAREFLEPANIRCRMEVPADLPDAPLTAEARHNIFLVAKEALNNVARHSKAAQVTLSIALGGGELIVEIKDDGHGFEPPAQSVAGNGLKNMAGRMADLGGEFQIRSKPGEGTTISFRMRLGDPLSHAKQRLTGIPRATAS